MKSKMNKKVLIVLFCVLAACVAALIIILTYDSTPKMTEPFKDLKRDEISKVIMNHGKTHVEVDDGRMDEFVELVKAIRIGKTTTDTEIDGFERGNITICYTNGKEQHISPCGKLFDIDGVTYDAEYDPCNKLGQMRTELLYPEQSQAE